MGATFHWSESNHIAEDVTDDIVNLNFVNEDNPQKTPVSSYPITAGENAYEKYMRTKFTGTFTEITNMKFWKSAGVYVTAEDIKAAANQSYATPVSTTSVIATVTIPITVGTALAIQSTEGDTSKITINGGYTKYIVTQLQTSISTPAGPVNQKTFTFQYDET